MREGFVGRGRVAAEDEGGAGEHVHLLGGRRAPGQASFNVRMGHERVEWRVSQVIMTKYEDLKELVGSGKTGDAFAGRASNFVFETFYGRPFDALSSSPIEEEG